MDGKDEGILGVLKGRPTPGTPRWDAALAEVQAASRKHREALEAGRDAEAETLLEEVGRLRMKCGIVEQAPDEED